MSWLIIIDPQKIFTDQDSDWGSPMWEQAKPVIDQLVAKHDQVLVTRWLAPTDRDGSWGEYMDMWPYADLPDDHELFDVIADYQQFPVVSARTFGKWEEIKNVTGENPELTIVGVATECCVLASVIPALDAGATITVISDGCAGGTEEMHADALKVMSYFPPQVTVMSSAEYLAT